MPRSTSNTEHETFVKEILRVLLLNWLWDFWRTRASFILRLCNECTCNGYMKRQKFFVGNLLISLIFRKYFFVFLHSSRNILTDYFNCMNLLIIENLFNKENWLTKPSFAFCTCNELVKWISLEKQSSRRNNEGAFYVSNHVCVKLIHYVWPCGLLAWHKSHFKFFFPPREQI